MSLPEQSSETSVSSGNRPRRGTLAVEVTSRCNRSCIYCYNGWRGDPALGVPDRPVRELAALVNRVMDESGLGAVQLTGGEPLLYPGLVELIEAIQVPGRVVSLVTDGGLVEESIVAELKRLGVGPVQPTLLAARREVHNELKGADCFDDTLAAIALLRRHKVPVSVSFVCTRRNFQHFRDVVELCFSLGIRVVAFSRFCTAGHGASSHDELIPDARMVASCMEVAEEANSRLGMRVIMAITLPLCVVEIDRYPHLTFGRCALSTDNPGFTMDPAGNLRACSISSTVLGNLQTESWQAIMARAGKGYFRQMSAPPESCRACALLARCNGGCRESALQHYGDASHPDPLLEGSR